ncbi:putative sulfate exporter family transporter [Henriciella mobilis]|uniref:Putative sulfate exporter family transporter n=2 Tax=Henriciella mobilis TaxID=2305467 RepID=A0A399R966_9PROT|nr:putative sulfate exporter family transporter [Henriciella mobilis]
MAIRNEMIAAPWPRWLARPMMNWDGLLLAGIVSLCGVFLSNITGAPVLLLVLVIGLMLKAPSANDTQSAGLNLAGDAILKAGVALLGMQITLSQIAALGWATALLVLTSLVMTLAIGWQIGKWAGLKSESAIIAASAVAICGASAALAIASVLPRKAKDDTVILSIIGVTTLSTAAMIAYPALAQTLGLNDAQAGILFGAAIHDVAQVVGAGALFSSEATETSAIVKLLRVACLMPVALVVGILFSCESVETDQQITLPRFPIFLIIFAVLVGINSIGLVPEYARSLANALSQGCLILAVAAIGIKTSFSQLLMTSGRVFLVLAVVTVLLGGGVLGSLLLFFETTSI